MVICSILQIHRDRGIRIVPCVPHIVFPSGDQFCEQVIEHDDSIADIADTHPCHELQIGFMP